MKRWQVLKSYAMIENNDLTHKVLIQDGVSICKFTKLDDVRLRVKWTNVNDAVTFSDFDTGEMYYVLYKDGVDYISDWAMKQCTDF